MEPERLPQYLLLFGELPGEEGSGRDVGQDLVRCLGDEGVQAFGIKQGR